MRTCLSPGTVIPVTGEGATRQVYIEQVIGEGASCIVYDGFFVDVPGVKERCRLKECYPLDAKIVRQGNRLVWSNPAERLSAQKRFQSVRQISFDMRYNPEVGNQIIKSGYYENGDNFYLVMDINHGQTLDKENTKDINRILKIALKLTQLVGKLHNLGYRYLDLKPDNILVSNDPDPDIWLFDFDSLVPMDNSNTISYSKGWAAPELVQGKFSSLCNATNLYSVGSILFHKIMGRSVTSDDIGLFAEWDFTGEIFDDVNPKVQRYLRGIFKKTLSAFANRRYQNAAELTSTLEQALGEIGKPYVLSNIPDNSANFVGRDQELLDICKAFSSGSHIVFLTGIGGIGKSELAKRYGNTHQANYDAVIFAPFEDSVNSSLLNIEIQNFDGDEKRKIKQLNRLLDRGILLVIDNMDTEEVPDLDILEKLKCDILITSRLDWREYSFPIIEISAMSEADQYGLFLKEYGGALDIPQQQAALSILSSIEGYTLLIPLIAKQLRKGYCNFDEISSRIRSVGIKAASSGKVRHLKDGMTLSGSVYGILSEVLNMAGFTEKEEYVMQSLTLLSNYKIAQTEFLQWLGSEYIDQLDDLVFNHWAIRETQQEHVRLLLHPVISELCTYELQPDLISCYGIANHFEAIAQHLQRWEAFDDDEYIRVEPTARILFGFLATIDLKNADNLKYCVRVLYTLLDGSIDFLNYYHDENVKILIRKIYEQYDSVSLSDDDRYKACIVIEAAWFSKNPPLFDSELPGNDGDWDIIASHLIKSIVSADYAIKDVRLGVFENAIASCYKLNSGDLPNALFEVLKIAIQGMYYAHIDVDVDDLSINILDENIEWHWYDLAKTLMQFASEYLVLFSNQQTPQQIGWIEIYLSYINQFVVDVENSDDEELEETDDLTPEERQAAHREWANAIVKSISGPDPEAAAEIVNNPELTNIEKARHLHIQEPFNTWIRHTHDYNAERWLEYHNWEYISTLLDAQAELLFSEHNDWSTDDANFFGDVTVNRAITWAILEMYEPFSDQMRKLLTLHSHELHMQLAEEKPILLSVAFDNSHFGHAINALRCIYRSDLGFSYVKDLIDLLEVCVEMFGDFTKRDILHFYQMALDMADEAIKEDFDEDGTFAREKADLSKTISEITGVDTSALVPKDE